MDLTIHTILNIKAYFPQPFTFWESHYHITGHLESCETRQENTRAGGSNSLFFNIFTLQGNTLMPPFP